MNLTAANEIVVDENDLVEMFLQDIKPNMVTMATAHVIEQYNHFCDLFLFSSKIDVELAATNEDKYNAALIDNWYIPEHYKDIDARRWILNRPMTHEERERVMAELQEFQDRGMMPLLNFLLYMVDTMRENNIGWGVGRGSSVASYVLYLIGVHRINSMKYNLDYKEFFR
jgi:DNA polymerase III alpha subunit